MARESDVLIPPVGVIDAPAASAMASPARRLDGVIDAATALLDGGVTTVESVHRAIARRSFASLRIVPLVGEVSEVVGAMHHGIACTVYATIRAAVAVCGLATSVTASVARTGDASTRPSDRGDAIVAVLNGFAGDRLARTGNPLATTMAVVRRGRTVALDRRSLAAVFSDASPRLAVFIHGLAGNEDWWRRDAHRHYGDLEVTYGSRLHDDLGYTPVYVRYNSGLHVSENGRQLAHVLERLVAEWPIAIEEIAIVGHSMGGLVARSACHYGRDAGCGWIDRVRHVVFLGSPHVGAPLEKTANVTAWMLGLTDVTRPFAEVLNARSVGIKDLRFGSIVDDDWRAGDVDALLVDRTADVPLLESASHYFVAATVTRDAQHPLGVAVGDLLVREASASGRGRARRLRFPIEHGRRFGPMTHLELLNHPDVYDQLRSWLGPNP